MSATRLLVLLECAAAGGLLECAAAGGLLGAQQPEHGYKQGDVTQGIGYGHHLHPFYYQGPSRRYYNCAIEDEWTPLPEDRPKAQQINVPKKYTPEEDKVRVKNRLVSKHQNRHPKIINIIRKTNFEAMQKRGDRFIFDGSKLKKHHEKLEQDIESLNSPPRRIKEATVTDQKMLAHEVHEVIVEPPIAAYTAPTFAPRRPTATIPRPVDQNPSIDQPSYVAVKSSSEQGISYLAPTKIVFNAVEVNRGVYPHPSALAGENRPPYQGALGPVTYRKIEKFAHRPPRISLLQKFIKFILNFT